MKLLFLLPLVALPLVRHTQAGPLQGQDSRARDPTVPRVAPAKRPRFAALDDVRLLANGLLQLGQNLREFVHKTRGQIGDISRRLGVFDHSVGQLSVLAGEIRQEEEELKRSTLVLRANDEEIRSLTLAVSSKVEGLLQERGPLWRKVAGLEETVSDLSRGPIPAERLPEITHLKEVVLAQDHDIKELLSTVREQRDQLNDQKHQIKTIEEKGSRAVTLNPTLTSRSVTPASRRPRRNLPLRKRVSPCR